MRAYAVQMHLHGSCSEGSGSCLAHDHEAAETENVDLIWWTDHDFRVANFAKVPGYAFNALLEHATIPNRKGTPGEPTQLATMTWVPVTPEGTIAGVPAKAAAAPPAGDPEGGPVPAALAESDVARISTDVLRSGTGSLRLALPAGDPVSERLYEFVAQTQYHRFPLLSRPIVKLAVHPGAGAGTHGEVVVRFVLSEQPPDLDQPTLTYVIGGGEAGAAGGAGGASHVEGMGGTIALPWKSGEWNEYTFDLAADVERLGLAGGLDNSLHKVLIGLRRSPSGSSGDASGHAPVVAYFDSLEIAPRVKGTAVLDLHRELLAQLPTRVQHLVGIEVSYYGRHINAFGSQVPIPDYQGLLPKALTSAEVVDHIHRHGGLACLNHPPRVDVDTTAATLAEQGVFGADLMEVAHGVQGLDDRLRLWDRLAQLGQIVTGVGVSDAHTSKQGWRERPGQPVRWVTRIWAESLSEEELLAGLRLGRVFFADPAAFRGTIQLTGPSGAAMGDVLALASAQAPALAVRCEGLQPGDLVAWLSNGHLVHAGSATGETYEAAWQPSAPVESLQALRVQIHRPRLAGNRWGGIIACSNPLYLAPAERAPETTHRLIRIS